MAFPDSATLLDDFEAADADPMGAPWADFIPFYGTGGLRRLSGMARTSAATALRRGMQHETSTFTETEVWANVALVPTTAAQRIDLWARCGDRNLSTQYGYAIQVIQASPDTWRMIRRSGGVTTTLASDVSGPTIADGDDIGLEVTGTGATVTLKAYHRPAAGSWTLVGTWTDTSGSRLVAAGYVALGFGDSATQVEEIYAGEISAGGGGGTVTAVALDATGDVASPVVVAGAVVAAAAPVASGDIAVPVVSNSANATVTAVPLDATGDVAIATLTGGATVTAVPLDATGDVATASMPVSVAVDAVPLDATGDVAVPAVEASGTTAVSAVAVDATGDVAVPVVVAGAVVAAAALDGTGDVAVASVSGGELPAGGSGSRLLLGLGV